MSAAPDDDVIGKVYDSRLMGRLLKYLRPYKWQAAVSFVAILLKAATDVSGPFLFKVAIDNYLTSKRPEHPNWLARQLSPSPASGITELAALYLGALLLTYLFEFIQTYLIQWMGQKVMFDLRSQIFRHIQQMHVGFFDRNPVGRLVTRLTSDVDALERDVHFRRLRHLRRCLRARSES